MVNGIGGLIGGVEDAILNVGKKQEPKSPGQIDCEAKGGTWDAARQVCILPPPKELPPPASSTETPQELETFRDVGTGKQSGITTEDGRTFLGLSPDEVSEVARLEQRGTEQPLGTAPVGTAQAQAEEAAKLQETIAQIGQIGQLTAAQQADINISQAATAGLARVIPGLLGGAAGGAAVGAVSTGGIGAAPAAAIGAIGGTLTGFTSGLLGNIKEQQRGELQASDIELTNARTNMRQLAMLASQDPANADVYIAQYNNQLTRLHQARRQTKVEVQGDLNAFMEDGREQLADFDAFLQPGGTADIYGQKLSIALSSGVPLSINGQELFPEELP